jgi:hypothetical protein
MTAARPATDLSATSSLARIGLPASPAMESSDGVRWYEGLRERYRPERLRYLLIAESPAGLIVHGHPAEVPQLR